MGGGGAYVPMGGASGAVGGASGGAAADWSWMED